jgi:uncharacterized protein (UPF0216 family)
LSPVFDKIIEHNIDTANDHLPVKRITLQEIGETGSLVYQTRGGETSAFRQEEIERLLQLVPSYLHSEIRLPIVILRRMDLGRGIFTVAGNKVELFLVNQLILGYVDLLWGEIGEWMPVERLVRPEVQTLRRRLPSTTTIGFTLSTDENQSQTEH